MRTIFRTLTIVVVAAMLAGCNASKRIVYNFNKDEVVKSIVGDGQIRIKPHDRL